MVEAKMVVYIYGILQCLVKHVKIIFFDFISYIILILKR